MNQAGNTVEKAFLQHIRLEKPEERAAQQSPHTIVLVAAPRQFVVGIGVRFAQYVAHTVVGQMLKSQFAAPRRDVFHPAVHLR